MPMTNDMIARVHVCTRI